MLRFQLQSGIVSLSKSANPERVRQNFDIFDFTLTEEDMTAIQGLNTDTTVFADHHQAQTIEALAGYVGRPFKSKLVLANTGFDRKNHFPFHACSCDLV